MVHCACCSLHGAWSGLQVCCVLHGAYSFVDCILSIPPFIVADCCLLHVVLSQGAPWHCCTINSCCVHAPTTSTGRRRMRARRGTAAACVPTGWYPVSTQDTPPVSLSTPEENARRNRRRRLHQQGRRPINQERTERSAAQSWRGRECAGVGRRRRPVPRSHADDARRVPSRDVAAELDRAVKHLRSCASKRISPALLVRRRAAPLQQSPPRGRLDT